MKRDIAERTYKFSVEIVKFCGGIKRGLISDILVKQLVRSGTSIGANIEEAQDGMSRADFLKGMSIALKESRETIYWLRMIQDLKVGDVKDLLNEGQELVKIFVAIVKKTKSGL